MYRGTRHHLWKPLLSAACCVGIAGFTVGSMASGRTLFVPAGDPAPLEAADDPVKNGLHILEPLHADFNRGKRVVVEKPAILLLDDWTYSDGPKPSGFK